MTENEKVLRQNRGLGTLLANIGAGKGPSLITPPPGNRGSDGGSPPSQKGKSGVSQANQGFDLSAGGFSGWDDLNSGAVGGNQSRSDEGNGRNSGMMQDANPEERGGGDFKRQKQDYEEPPPPEPKKWSDMLQYNDDHDQEWFDAENARLAEEYGEGVVTVTYIENGGRVGYFCEICVAEMNAKKSLKLHCGGMKHLKKKNLWDKSRGVVPFNPGIYFPLGSGYQQTVSFSLGRPSVSEGFIEANPDAAKNDEPDHEEKKIPRGRRVGDLGQNRGGRGFGRYRGERDIGDRGDGLDGREQDRGDRDDGLDGRERDRGDRDHGPSVRGWDYRRRVDYDDITDTRRVDYVRPPYDLDLYRLRGSPPRSYDDRYSDRRGQDYYSSDYYRRDRYGSDSYGLRPHLNRSPPSTPLLIGGLLLGHESLSTGATGMLLRKLAACSVKNEDDGKLATEVIDMLVKALKEYNQKKGCVNIVHLLNDIAVKVNFMKALETEVQSKPSVQETLMKHVGLSQSSWSASVPPPSSGNFSVPSYLLYPPGHHGTV